MPDEQNKRPERLWKDLEQAETKHLSYEQLAGYVDSNLEPTEAELVRAHTELCVRCAGELRDLKAFAVGLKEKELPVKPGAWERFTRWVKIPRHALALAGVVAILVVIVALPHQAPNPGLPETSAALRRHPVEAVLDPQQAPPGARVLTEEERQAYYKELAAAPDDPEARAAIAIRYSLFGEAEKAYRKIETTPEGRRLLQQLDQLRGR